jgi:hypothetical protein
MQTDILPIQLLPVSQFNHTILYFNYADRHFANTVTPGFSIQSYYFIFHFANTDSPNFTIQSYYFIFQLCKGTFCQYRFSQFYNSIILFYISVMQTDILSIQLLPVLLFNHTILYFSYADGHFANTVTRGFTIQSHYSIFQLCRRTFCQYSYSRFYNSITLFYVSVMQTDILPIQLLPVLQFNHLIYISVM